MGGITEVATSAPGNSSLRPNTKAPMPDVLRMNGYSTAQLGKCHEVPVWQTSPMGPFDMWPTGSGFEYFYGFIGGEDNQWNPALYEGTTPVEPQKTPEEGYHLTEDLADRGIAWVNQQKALMPDKPFFMYFAPGATHAPHHVPKEWIEKYRGQFDDGWDRQRERTFARQKELGVIPQDCELTPRHDEIPAWEDIPDDLKPVLARQMEVYAAFLEHTDHHVGRLVDAIEALGALDDTLVYVMIGDNGASAEGTPNGAFNEMANFNGMAALETTEFLVQTMDKLGSPEAYTHYSVGWAHAMDTPYQWTKQVASHWGGTRNGTIVHWPSGIEARGEVRSQFCHVIDVCPTVLEVAGLPHPVKVNGVQQAPIEGTSMAYSFDDAGAPERHDLQYFEMFATRGIYHKGWSAVTKHRTPWVMGAAELLPFDDDVWELYDGSVDWSQANDLSQGDAREAPRAAASVANRGDEIQRHSARRPHRRTDRSGHRRPAAAGPRDLTDAVRGNGQAVGAQRPEHQEQVVLDHGRDRGARGRRRRPDRRAGRALRRLGPIREGQPGRVRLQRARPSAVRDGGRAATGARYAPGADGVRVRRRWPGQGGRRHALLRRRTGGQGSR
jgi:arylsulfatase